MATFGNSTNRMIEQCRQFEGISTAARLKHIAGTELYIVSRYMGSSIHIPILIAERGDDGEWHWYRHNEVSAICKEALAQLDLPGAVDMDTAMMVSIEKRGFAGALMGADNE